jgi:hypothetical protein
MFWFVVVGWQVYRGNRSSRDPSTEPHPGLHLPAAIQVSASLMTPVQRVHFGTDTTS